MSQLHANHLHGTTELATIAGVEPVATDNRFRGWLGMSRKHTAVWLTTLVLVGAAFGLIIVLLLRFVDGPVESTQALSKLQASTAPKSTTKLNQLAGIAVELSYPAIFDGLSQLKNDAQAVEQYNLSSKRDYSRGIAVSVRSLPSGNLNDDSSYRFRLNSTADYRETKEILGGEPIAVMNKLDRSEQTLFWAHGDKVLTLAITATNPRDDVSALMSAIKPTIRWRR